YTRADLIAGPVVSCAANATGTNTVSGTAAGLGATDLAILSIGSGSAVIIGASPAFSATSVVTGVSDLVAYKTDALGSTATDRALIRRDVNVTGNISVGTVDFNGGESFAPAPA